MTFFFCLQRYQLLALVLLVSVHLLLAQLRRVHFVSTEHHQYKCLYEYRKTQVCRTVCLFLLPPRECSKAVCKATYHHCKDKELRDSAATSYLVIFIISKHVYQSNNWTSDWTYLDIIKITKNESHQFLQKNVSCNDSPFAPLNPFYFRVA